MCSHCEYVYYHTKEMKCDKCNKELSRFKTCGHRLDYRCECNSHYKENDNSLLKELNFGA